jgi:AcrR family transcriptional regulator
MRESKAKKRILEVADGMFKELGYANLNVNEIAHKAEVSIGTLYYHFPEGKTSILMDIRRQVSDQYMKNFAERFDVERLKEAKSFDEGLRLFLEGLIDIHRKDRLILAAMESKVLSNLSSYDQLAESVDVGGLMESDARPVIGVLEALLKSHPEDDLSLDGRGVKISKVVDLLIHRFVYVESIFGSEKEFIDMMVKIVRALLK